MSLLSCMVARSPMPRQVARPGHPSSGLPPMIYYWNSQLAFSPVQRRRIGTLTGQEKCTQSPDTVPLDHYRIGVFTPDRSNRRGRSEQHVDLMIAHDAPECAGVGGADRLAFVENRGAANDQWRIDDVAMTDDPADIRRRPASPARTPYIFDMLHASATAWPPLSRTTPLGIPVVPDIIEDVERIGRCHGNTFHRLR